MTSSNDDGALEPTEDWKMDSKPSWITNWNQRRGLVCGVRKNEFAQTTSAREKGSLGHGEEQAMRASDSSNLKDKSAAVRARANGPYWDSVLIKHVATKKIQTPCTSKPRR